MFVILTYDIGVKRVAKVMKVCRKYLVHIQKSVFEGDLTDKQLRHLKREIRNIIDYNHDSVRIYKFGSLKYSSREEIGVNTVNNQIV